MKSGTYIRLANMYVLVQGRVYIIFVSRDAWWNKHQMNMCLDAHSYVADM